MIQFIRGNTAANDAYTGPNGSLSVDTEANNIRLHDGVNPGGVVIANIDQAGAIKSISATAPIVISGTTSDPVIEIQPATTSQDGYMSSTDKSNLDTAYGWGDHSIAGYESQSNKGAANGYAGLDGTGKVPSTQLPSFVDDILEYSTQANFPTTGETGKIYVAIDTGKTYRWGGSSYTEISSGAVDSVNGQTGAVVIPNADETSAGLVSTGTQTFAGDKTFTGVITIDEGVL